MEEILYYQITPEKFLEADEILEKLQKIKRVEHRKILFGRWEQTESYKRIYVDASEKYHEIGYIDLIRIKFVVTARFEDEIITIKLIDNVSKKINTILDEYRNYKFYK
ncbi:hypothetical protein [uncultured Clostridium sp.]|uniref:hypothetical protein n=1 Tax=uncultured Clostridium sp. TaxID=59620 RepID=UPI002603766B|nr:hypothetical protein [uncultured Clostridium sp.]MCI8310131.1 hypothetical protein [Clostridia bacterium]